MNQVLNTTDEMARAWRDEEVCCSNVINNNNNYKAARDDAEVAEAGRGAGFCQEDSGDDETEPERKLRVVHERRAVKNEDGPCAAENLTTSTSPGCPSELSGTTAARKPGQHRSLAFSIDRIMAVSYTHLTLPTIYSV